MTKTRKIFWGAWWSAVVTTSMAGAMAGCGSSEAPNFPAEDDATPASDSIGEALFLDTRFAEYFAAHMTGVNDPLSVGDPVVNQVETPNGPLPGPFAGQSINCRSCHFVTEFEGVPNAGNRTYSDFTTRSPIPLPMNGFDHTPRNAMQMVGTLQPHTGPVFLHFDGEFTATTDLIESTMTGRNFGWGPTQYQQALAHIAQVIREDNGSGQLAADRLDGLPYSVIFLGTDPRITSDIQLPAAQRLNVQTASEQQILDEMAMCISQYMKDLRFQHDEYGRYIGSPYDVFLRVNHLPVQPRAGQSIASYNQELYGLVVALNNPIYVTDAAGSFKYHPQPFQFGATELAGLRIFLKTAQNATDGSQHAGNCAACHTAPDFTDFNFHTTGVSQDEYDSAHGTGAFMALAIPGLSDRNANYDAYLPVTPNHPNATERFRHMADPANPQFADLGLWNIYLNPDKPNPQANLKMVVCATGVDCSVDQGLAQTIAEFKTPTLRDLEDSAPYFHNGSRLTFDEVVSFYINSSTLARAGQLRNAPAQFAGLSISQADLPALVAFLKSLTEDYDDT
jgi:cytochrome c peroxidase